LITVALLTVASFPFSFLDLDSSLQKQNFDYQKLLRYEKNLHLPGSCISD